MADIEILLLKETKDSDLKEGLKVCYKNIDGVYNNLGIITDIKQPKLGGKEYLINTSFGSYMANELKLLK